MEVDVDKVGNPDTQIFTATLYIKPIHSRCVTPWDSHGSISSKGAIVTGEVNRAIKCSTDSTTQKKSLNLITELFTANGYPKTFIKAIIRRTIHKNRQRNNKQDNEPEESEQQQFTYVKLPFINEEFKRQAISVVKRSRIPNIRLQFINGQPLSKVFAPPKTKQNCQSECEMCKLSSKPNLCLKKNVLYKIECSICGIVYIGETGRTIRSRIKEHLTMEKQTVYKHLESHKKSRLPTIKWMILHANIVNDAVRKYVEAFEIQKHSGDLMNGCTGRIISV